MLDSSNSTAATVAASGAQGLQWEAGSDRERMCDVERESERAPLMAGGDGGRASGTDRQTARDSGGERAFEREMEMAALHCGAGEMDSQGRVTGLLDQTLASSQKALPPGHYVMY